MPGSGRDETEQERGDRNLGELLGELRVALPGVQVLFAFLLVVPFNQGFEGLSAGQERLYLQRGLCLGAPDRPHGSAPAHVPDAGEGVHRARG